MIQNNFWNRVASLFNNFHLVSGLFDITLWVYPYLLVFLSSATSNINLFLSSISSASLLSRFSTYVLFDFTEIAPRFTLNINFFNKSLLLTPMLSLIPIHFLSQQLFTSFNLIRQQLWSHHWFTTVVIPRVAFHFLFRIKSLLKSMYPYQPTTSAWRYFQNFSEANFVFKKS